MTALTFPWNVFVPPLVGMALGLLALVGLREAGRRARAERQAQAAEHNRNNRTSFTASAER